MTHALKPVVWGLWLSAEKLAKFDSSQVCSEMPFFKRQKEGEAFALDSHVPLCVCACACVRYFYLVTVPRRPQLSFQSVMQTIHLTLLFIAPLIACTLSMLYSASVDGTQERKCCGCFFRP